MRIHATAVLILSACAALAHADTLTLRNGQVVRGTFLGGTTRQLSMDVNGETRTFDLNQVQSLTISDASAVMTPPPAPPPAAPAPPAIDHAGVVIPRNTIVVVTMIDAVDSKSAAVGQTFRASLDEPLVIDGQTIARRGSDVVTKLVTVQQSGNFSGKTVLSLALDTVMIDGRQVPMASEDVTQSSASRAPKSVGAVGGGAGLGAIIGGIAGGGLGAAVGAAAGAGAGAASQVMLGGEKVKIPSETRLDFRLSSDVPL